MSTARTLVVVTDGEQRSALSTVRSLGRAGYDVVVCASRRGSLAGASRYCTREVIVPDPLEEAEGFAQRLRVTVTESRAAVLVPVSEASLLAVLPQRDTFAARIPFPSADVFRRVCDKAFVLTAAAAQGIAVPAQHTVRGQDEVAATAASLQFPVVVKPSRSVVADGTGHRKTSVRYAGDAGALEAICRSLPATAFPALLQERIAGPGTAISILLWDGDLIAAFAHRRLREKPPSGGVSVLRESIPLDADLLDRSVKLLRALEWQGVAMVEYKVSSATRRPYLMEINGRLWGSLQLAVDSGVDFPRMLVEAALGAPPRPLLEYPSGVRTRWEWGDADHLLAMLRHSRTTLWLPRDAPGRLRALGGFLRDWLPPVKQEVLRRDDPRPFLRETLNWFARR